MTTLDTLAPNYLRAAQRWPGAATLANGYEALAACFRDSAHGLVEHVKSFVESVCLTIMVERSRPIILPRPNCSWRHSALLGVKTRGVDKLDGVLSGFNKLSDALSCVMTGQSLTEKMVFSIPYQLITPALSCTSVMQLGVLLERTGRKGAQSQGDTRTLRDLSAPQRAH